MTSRACKPSVCIVSLYAWPLFEPAAEGAFGGSEVRIASIARGLARRGSVHVSVVVWDHGQGARTAREGIGFFAWPEKAPSLITVEQPPVSTSRFGLSVWARENRSRGGLRGALSVLAQVGIVAFRAMLRAYYPIASRAMYWRDALQSRLRAGVMIGDYAVDRSRLELLDRINPDVVLVHGATSVSAEIVAWARTRGKTSLFVAGSDNDFLAEFKANPRKMTPYGDTGRVVSFAVENASAHVVQTPAQANLLNTVYGRDSVVIRNPVDLERTVPRAEDGTVLWVGKSDHVKRPQLAIEVARRIPGARFLLVMNPSNPQLHREVELQARELGNVAIEPVVPFQEIESRFARASVLLNTSAFEGFPNAFLQAAKYEVPIASLHVDPGEMLTTHGAGICAHGDIDALVRAVSLFLSDDATRRAAGARALAYARDYHDQEKALDAVEGLLHRLTAAPARVGTSSVHLVRHPNV